MPFLTSIFGSPVGRGAGFTVCCEVVVGLGLCVVSLDVVVVGIAVVVVSCVVVSVADSVVVSVVVCVVVVVLLVVVVCEEVVVSLCESLSLLESSVNGAFASTALLASSILEPHLVSTSADAVMMPASTTMPQICLILYLLRCINDLW